MIGAASRNAFFEEVVERTIGGERLSKCIQCGTCGGSAVSTCFRREGRRSSPDGDGRPSDASRPSYM